MRLAPLPPVPKGEEELFGGSLGPLYRAMGVLPDPSLAEDPLYLFQQVAGGLPHGEWGWVVERLWPPPPLTRREALRRLVRFGLEAGEEAFLRIKRLLRPEEAFPDPPLEDPLLSRLGVHRARHPVLLTLMEAVRLEEGEAYHPREAGLPEEVVAGMIVEGRV